MTAASFPPHPIAPPSEADTPAAANNAVAPPPGDTPAHATLDRRIESLLRSALAEHLSYPPLARRKGQEGTVTIELRVEATGRISRLQLIHSSGYALLDRAALDGVRRVDTLAQASNWLNGEHFDMVLPIAYQLTNE